MKSTKTLSIVGIIVVVLALGSYVIAKTLPSDNSNVVRVGYLSSVLGFPHHVALEKGLYEKANLKIEATEFQSSNQLYDALAQGNIDIAPELSALPVLINDLKDPGKIQIFSTTKINSERPFDQLLAPKKMNLTIPSDLAGKKIGVFPGSTATAFLKDYLTKNNVDISKIEFIQIPPANQAQAFMSGSIDALYAYEPVLSQLIVKEGAIQIGSPIYASYLQDNPVGTGVVTTKFVQASPELAQKTINVYNEVFSFLEQNDTEARAIIEKTLHLDSDVAEQVNFMYQTLSTQIDQKHFQAMVDILLSLKELPSQPDLSHLFYK